MISLAIRVEESKKKFAFHRCGKVCRWLNMYYSNIKIITFFKVTSVSFLIISKKIVWSYRECNFCQYWATLSCIHPNVMATYKKASYNYHVDFCKHQNGCAIGEIIWLNSNDLINIFAMEMHFWWTWLCDKAQWMTIQFDNCSSLLNRHHNRITTMFRGKQQHSYRWVQE